MHNIHICKTEDVALSHLPFTFKKVYLKTGVIDDIGQIASVILKPGDEIEVHSHLDMTEIFYIVKGKIQILSEDIEKILGEDEVFIVQPKTEHGIKVLSETKLFYFGII